MLVTHHVDLCLPKAKYTILLGEGIVEHAGFVDDLRRTGIIDEILQPEEKTEKTRQMSQEELVIDGDSDRELLCRVLSKGTETNDVIDDEQNVQMEQSKKFTADEKRETGAIKFGIYKEYLNTSGGWWFWILVLTMFAADQGLIIGRVSLFTPFFLFGTDCIVRARSI